MLADHPAGKLVKMLDFGLAKILFGDLQESLLLSATGAVFGTHQYMSPEQCQGKPPDLQKRAELRFQNGAALCGALQTVPGYRPLRGPTASPAS